jgi:hypothetical protein
MTLLCYTYEADHHCEACTDKRFPGIPEDAVDNEGNVIGAVFSWDEWHQGTGEDETLACSDCGGVLDEYKVEPRCDVCNVHCEEADADDWCSDCGNCREHCAQYVDCPVVEGGVIHIPPGQGIAVGDALIADAKRMETF